MEFPVPIFQFFTVGQQPIRYPDTMPIVARQVPPKDCGFNYAESIRYSFEGSRSPLGIVTLEHDVAVPLEAWEEMLQLIGTFPGRVVAVPFILYPASTQGIGRHWANQRNPREGVMEVTPANEKPPLICDTFGLGCTFLPKALLDKMPDDLQHWGWPATDWKLSQLAMENEIGVRCTLATAVHLHY